VWRTENTNLAILELLHVGIGWSLKITTQENVMLSPTEWVNALMLCAFHEPSGISECPWFPKAINTSSSTQGSLLIGPSHSVLSQMESEVGRSPPGWNENVPHARVASTVHWWLPLRDFDVSTGWRLESNCSAPIAAWTGSGNLH
jgi:hypothetical protein